MPAKSPLLLGCLLLLAAPSVLDVSAQPEVTTAIVGATVIDGTGADPMPDAVVVIDGDRITAVGPRAKVEIPASARMLDARGRWIIPGLIDAHVHFFQSGGLYTRPDVIDLREQVPYPQELQTIRHRLRDTFRRYLCSGVTSVVDVGGPLWNFEVRQMASQTQLAPRVAVAGPLISTYAPKELASDDPAIIQVHTADEARALVRRQVAEQPELVKIWFIRRPGTNLADQLPLVQATIEESRAHQVRVAVHATELETAKAAVRAGAAVLVHSVHDQPVDEEFIQLLTERTVIYTTTLVVFEGYQKVLTQKVRLTDIDRICGDPEVIASWENVAQLPEDKQPRRPSWADRAFQVMPTNLKRLQQAGALIAVGTDAGNIGTLHGPAIHREFELLAEAGLTPMEILVAATRTAARVVRAKPEIGTLEPGQLADLVILEADPLADIRNARKIHKVIKGGEIFDHSLLRNPN